MRIGYLHLGAPEHGVRRYGALLAAEGRRRGDVEIVEAESALVGDPRRDSAALVEVGRRLSGADIVHLQYNPKIWGRGHQLSHVRAFARHCQAPLVATVHDVYARAGAPGVRLISSLRRRARALHGSAVEPGGDGADGRIAAAAARIAYRRMTPSSYAALRWLLNHARAALVSSGEEARRLPRPVRARVGVVPHFVEQRVLSIDRDQARAALGLEGKTTVTLLGFIHVRKGHHLVVDALSELEHDVHVVFAGRATSDGPAYLEDVLALAEARGVRDRVRVTGYVPEKILDQYLAATDLAVCPFLDFSASGSLSTWFSVGRPIIASDLPQIREYSALEPGAVHTFRPLTGAGLAEAIREHLAGGAKPGNPAASRLAGKLGIATVFQEHLEWYRAAAGQGRLDLPAEDWRTG